MVGAGEVLAVLAPGASDLVGQQFEGSLLAVQPVARSEDGAVQGLTQFGQVGGIDGLQGGAGHGFLRGA
ncbi:hypothetical protein D9M69_577430 [compost metagenome]